MKNLKKNQSQLISAFDGILINPKILKYTGASWIQFK